jgi:hypothetical protein
MQKHTFIFCILWTFGTSYPSSDTGNTDSVAVRNILFRVSSSSFSSLRNQRVFISRPPEESASPVHIHIDLEGQPCESASTGPEFLIRIEIDGSYAGNCSGCHCTTTIPPISDGPHMLVALVFNSKTQFLASRELLFFFYSDGNRGLQDPDLVKSESCPALRILHEYTELHRRILDPDDKSVPKRFLVVSSSHGLANTQIEEVIQPLLPAIARSHRCPPTTTSCWLCSAPAAIEAPWSPSIG